MLLSSISLALTRLGQRLGRWSPLALWPNGISTPGMWISPSTLPASFNDYLGTTPVATPGTVADSANPVGLALDIRAGAPDTLGPELVTNGDFAAGSTGWSLETGWSVSGGQASISNAGDIYTIYQGGLTSGKTYFISFTITSISAGGFTPYCGDNLRNANFNTVGTHTAIFVCGANDYLGVRPSSGGTIGSVTNISFKEIPGNHMLQSTSAARPLESARVNLLTYTEDFENAAWSDVGGGTTTATYGGLAPDGTSTAWSIVYSQANTDIRNSVSIPLSGCCRHIWIKGTSGETISGNFFASGISTAFTGDWQKFEYAGTSGQAYAWIGTWDGATARTVSLWHPQVELGSTATTYQFVNTDSDYDATGITPWQLYDGTDDGMATASFAPGTLIDGMDCLIAVRRDSAANAILGLSDSAGGRWFGLAAVGSGSVCFDSALGSPTVWVDNAQLPGGTAVTRDTLNTAMTVGDWHIMEFRDLDMSGYDMLRYGDHPAFLVNGARGDIMLYPSTASTTDKDAARQYLADYYGVTLP